jgi:hypothetical protein
VLDDFNSECRPCRTFPLPGLMVLRKLEEMDQAEEYDVGPPRRPLAMNEFFEELVQ